MHLLLDKFRWVLRRLGAGLGLGSARLADSEIDVPREIVIFLEVKIGVLNGVHSL